MDNDKQNAVDGDKHLHAAHRIGEERRKLVSYDTRCLRFSSENEKNYRSANRSVRPTFIFRATEERVNSERLTFESERKSTQL